MLVDWCDGLFNGTPGGGGGGGGAPGGGGGGGGGAPPGGGGGGGGEVPNKGGGGGGKEDAGVLAGDKISTSSASDKSEKSKPDMARLFCDQIIEIANKELLLLNLVKLK